MAYRFTFQQLYRSVVTISALGLALTACKTETEPGLEAGTDYYPLEVGTYRTFDVTDSTWNSNKTDTAHFQFRERVAETFTDAAGLPAYRIVRSKRKTARDAWQDDSVLVVNASAQTVLLTRNNRRTVELIFPVRATRAWNLNAYNNRDTIVAENRRYEHVGAPCQTRAGGKTYDYASTVTTVDAGEDDAFYYSTQRQVFAKGVGPVFRVRRRYFYCRAGDGSCIPRKSYIYLGRVRTETLVDAGRL